MLYKHHFHVPPHLETSSRVSFIKHDVAFQKSQKIATSIPAIARTNNLHKVTISKVRDAIDKGETSTSFYDGDKELEKTIDMVTFGNLCVDVLVHVNELPPKEPEGKWNYMQDLVANPPDKSFWEAGGQANSLISASRIGLNCTALGHIGGDVFGEFFREILEEEGVKIEAYEAEKGKNNEEKSGETVQETLVVWVLVDPNKNHAFCSRFDFNKEPFFSSLKSLPQYSLNIIKSSKSFLINGFIFDELSPKVVLAAARKAREGKTKVLFDPGPRTTPLVMGGFEGEFGGREALFELLRLSDVVLLTAEEAEVLTGLPNPTKAAFKLLEICGENTKWVIIKRGSHGCVLAMRENDFVYSMPGFRVPVADTVGCGDSFASAIALGFSRGQNPSCTLALANAVGAATAQGSGAGRNVANSALVLDILSGLKAENDGEYIDILECANFDPESTKLIVGPPKCSSGTPLYVAINGAIDLLKESLGNELLD